LKRREARLGQQRDRPDRRAIRAQEREIRMSQRAGVSTASAELLLARMRAKVDDLCRE